MNLNLTNPGAITVTLTDSELLSAWLQAGQRYFASRLDGRMSDQYGYRESMYQKLQKEMRGVMGEMAVAKALNLYHSAQMRVGAPDVGHALEVKAVAGRSLRLIVFKDKKNECRISVLTRIDDQDLYEVVLAGWAYQEDCRKPGNIESHRPGGDNHFVDNRELRPMIELMEMMAIKGVKIPDVRYN